MSMPMGQTARTIKIAAPAQRPATSEKATVIRTLIVQGLLSVVWIIVYGAWIQEAVRMIAVKNRLPQLQLLIQQQHLQHQQQQPHPQLQHHRQGNVFWRRKPTLKEITSLVTPKMTGRVARTIARTDQQQYTFHLRNKPTAVTALGAIRIQDWKITL